MQGWAHHIVTDSVGTVNLYDSLNICKISCHSVITCFHDCNSPTLYIHGKINDREREILCRLQNHNMLSLRCLFVDFPAVVASLVDLLPVLNHVHDIIFSVNCICFCISGITVMVHNVLPSRIATCLLSCCFFILIAWKIYLYICTRYFLDRMNKLCFASLFHDGS